MKKQRTFYIDLVLAAICLLTLITGLIIHAAGHGIVQSNVKIWRVTHIVWGVLFLILSTGHIRAHRRWYKSLPERFRQRSKVTVCLSAVYLLTSATGLILILHRENAGTHLGVPHYQVRHTGNLASVRTYENTPDNEKLPPFSFASQSRKREEHIYLQRLTKNLFQFKYGFRLYIFRRSSYNSLKFSRFCNPFMLLVIKKAQRRFVYCKRNCFSFSSSQFDFTETF